MNIKNQVQLVGRVGATPQIKVMENGTKLARFAIAINATYTSKSGEKISNTQWHNIAAWGSLANIAQSILHKGSLVTIDGKLISRTFKDKSGLTRHATEIVANELLLMNKSVKTA